MNFNNPIPLSEGGSFEKIVNDGATQRRAAFNQWLTKTLRTIVFLLAILLVNLILWLFRVIPSVPSIYVSEIVTCIVSFLVGRIWEVVKR